jgi:hypothetical protein
MAASIAMIAMTVSISIKVNAPNRFLKRLVFILDRKRNEHASCQAVFCGKTGENRGRASNGMRDFHAWRVKISRTPGGPSRLAFTAAEFFLL